MFLHCPFNLTEPFDDIKRSEWIDSQPHIYNLFEFNSKILVDQKLGAVFGQEIDFRLNLECNLSNQEALSGQEATNEQVEKVLKLKEKIPLVLIVVNGGTNTLLTVNQAINKNVPILILAVKNVD